MTKRIVSALLLLGGLLSAQAQGSTVDDLQKIMRKHRITPASVSVFVAPVDSQTPLLAWKADEPRNPASAIKLLTTFVALEELGPDFRWRTQSLSTVQPTGGRLPGDLYLKGFGDPYLVTENFWRFVRGIRYTGIEDIEGDIVIDNSYFQPYLQDPAEFDGRPERSYNVNPSALLLNFQSIHFRFRPEPDKGQLTISADPDPGLALQNQVKLTSGNCRAWKRRLRMKMIDQDKGVVNFSGRYAQACGEKSFYRVATDASNFIYGVFRNLWQQNGGQLQGRWQEGVTPGDAGLIYTLESPPMSDVIRAVNKYSNNVMTRQMLLTLGAEVLGPPGTEEKGIAVVQGWLKKNGFEFPELALENGAGRSRITRISAAHLGALLQHAYLSPRMPEFMSSLPIAAYDGTVQKRFANTPLEGRLHVKTGLLDDVRALAGYLTDAGNRRWVIVILHNHGSATSRRGEAFQESLLSWLYEHSLRAGTENE